MARSRQQSVPARRRERVPPETPREQPPLHIRVSVTSTDTAEWEETQETAGGQSTVEEPLPSEFQDLVDFIKVTIRRIRRSSVSSSTSSSSSSSSTTLSPSKENLSSSSRHRREKKSGGSLQTGKGGAGGGVTGRRVRGGGGGGGRGQGCALKQIHLNVTDLGLGYRSGEEMIFRYCSGPCRKSEANYDKILYNLAHNRRFPPKDTPSRACCRPTAFDDDLSFLDDNLVYHTLRKHSARKCGCV
ncbi:glial cell line-derived neurotrophic factor [Solea solea]|uniref:glial cell line-derived neurotrophic factor n=1 Tax=Solea solea TaxID=90069 RepID=UPI0027298868|nr:glial cell line-derived neurotrophic factor [Solea solea]